MSTEIAEILIDIEAELRQLGLWERLPPPASALVSDQPFYVDTLTLPQWLQFIFLPTLYQRIEERGDMPQRCGVAPMAEEYFKGADLAHGALVRALEQIDSVLSGENSIPQGAD